MIKITAIASRSGSRPVDARSAVISKDGIYFATNARPDATGIVYEKISGISLRMVRNIPGSVGGYRQCIGSIGIIRIGNGAGTARSSSKDFQGGLGITGIGGFYMGGDTLSGIGGKQS